MPKIAPYESNGISVAPRAMAMRRKGGRVYPHISLPQGLTEHWGVEVGHGIITERHEKLMIIHNDRVPNSARALSVHVHALQATGVISLPPAFAETVAVAGARSEAMHVVSWRGDRAVIATAEETAVRLGTALEYALTRESYTTQEALGALMLCGLTNTPPERTPVASDIVTLLTPDDLLQAFPEAQV